MTADSLTVRARVLDAAVFPSASDPLRRWLVRLAVEEVIDGELPDGRRELSILVHSPSREFRDSEPVGQTFVITFRDPLTDPYAGAFEVAPDRG